MRTFIILIICGLLAAACRPKQPAIEFETLTHDFDTISLKEVGNCTFVYHNIGNSPLVVERVSTSCGCTKITHTHRTVIPKDTGSVTIHYYPDSEGDFRKIAVVYSNAANSPKTVLKMKGFVKKVS